MYTGFRDLDSLIGGLVVGDLSVVGGRSGSGRTAFALNVALYAARHGEGVAIFSYDTTWERVVQRLTSALTSIPLRDLLGATVSRQDWPRLMDSRRNPVWSRLHICGSANLQVGQIRDSVRQISKSRLQDGRSPLSLVVVGPLRLMGSVAPTTEGERRRHLTSTVRLLKRMARELRVPVLLIGGLDLDLGDRHAEPPVLSDLEQSEVVQRHADKILLLHRRTSSVSDSGDDDVAEVEVAWQRNGPTGKVELGWQEDYGVFHSLPASTER